MIAAWLHGYVMGLATGVALVVLVVTRALLGKQRSGIRDQKRRLFDGWTWNS